MRTVDTRWVRGIGSRRETARRRIVVFHHAGGSASSYQLGKHFPADTEICAIQLPGRESRFAEPLLTTLDPVVDELTSVIPSDLPFAFFGHSMGALIAFEVARRLAPEHLFVSAHRAPHLADPTPLHGLDDDALADRLAATNPVLADPDLREIFLPILRADLALCETYTHLPGDPLPCPITVFGGRADDIVTESELREWRQHTSAGFELRMFPGDHFYLRGNESTVSQQIQRELAVQEGSR
jgi:medium-chain acyl-[acyl-carrier-protein] hydrolase